MTLKALSHYLDSDLTKQSPFFVSLVFKEHKLYVQLPAKANSFQPFEVKGSSMMGAVKFGSLLQNFLMSSSISKAMHVLGTTLSYQQLKLPCNLRPVVEQQADISGGSSSFDITSTTSSSSHLKPAELSFLEEKGQLDSVCVPPAITQSGEINEGKLNMLPPPVQVEFLEINNRKPLTVWERDDDIQVQHQKQTSSQLLHFLRVKVENEGALEVSNLKWTERKAEANNPNSPERMSPTVKTQSHQFRHVVTDEPVGEFPPASSHASVESQAPVFRVKRVKSSRYLIYSCVIATETELWDVGDVFTKALEQDSVHMTLESKKCQNNVTYAESKRNADWTSHTLRCTDPDLNSSPAHSETALPKAVNIPEFQIRKFEETEVVVSHVVSPGSFYIQNAYCLEKLQALSTG